MTSLRSSSACICFHLEPVWTKSASSSSSILVRRASRPPPSTILAAYVFSDSRWLRNGKLLKTSHPPEPEHCPSPLAVLSGLRNAAKTIEREADLSFHRARVHLLLGLRECHPRGRDPELCRLFIVDGAKALTKATRRTFGADIPIQRCQVHKACNITDRIDPNLHASVRRALRQAWEMDDCGKAERLLRNLTRRIELEAPGVSSSILEGHDEILTVSRRGLPLELRHSLARTNIIKAMNGVIRQVSRNVKRWRDAKLALRWTAPGMLDAAKGFRRLKAYKQLPVLKAALATHRKPEAGAPTEPMGEAA